MKKIFIALFISIMPLVIFLILYREVNGIDKAFDLELVINYLSNFTPFENFNEFIEYMKKSFNDINDMFTKINEIEIKTFVDVISKVLMYVVEVYKILWRVCGWFFELLKTILNTIIDTISFTVGLFQYVLKI